MPELTLPKLVTEEETNRLILALCRGQDGGATEEQMTALVAWVNVHRCLSHMVDLVIRGQVLVRMLENGEPAFWIPREPTADETGFVVGADPHPFILCRACGLKSYNTNDIDQRYCGNCHTFHEG